MNYKSIVKKLMLGGFFLLTSGSVFGQSGSSVDNLLNFFYNNIIFILSAVVILGILITLMKLASYMFDLQKARMMEEMGIEDTADADKDTGKSLFKSAYDWAWSIVPVGEEGKVDLGHDYDGIRELDNRLPPWWLAIMYGSIIFAFGYMYYYHWSDRGWSSIGEYEMAMEEAEEQQARFLSRMANAIDENSVTLLTDETSLEDGKSIYTASCLVCHGINGEGLVGPNFTDPYWIHGGGITDLFRVIKYGVPEKGMISWKSQLRPADMQKVASYILTFQGTNPPNQKAPEGELWTPEEGSGTGVLESSAEQ